MSASLPLISPRLKCDDVRGPETTAQAANVASTFNKLQFDFGTFEATPMPPTAHHQRLNPAPPRHGRVIKFSKHLVGRF